MDYFNTYKEMLSLRGLTAHTIKSYCTYIKVYLEYIDNVLSKSADDVTWNELRAFINWIQNQRGLSDRTINTIIFQLKFFTIYVLHKSWDSSQLPTRRFDEYLPYVPSQEDVDRFISSIEDLKFKAMAALLYSSGLRSTEVRHLKYADIERKKMRIYIRATKSRCSRYASLSKQALDILTSYWFACGKPTDWLFPSTSSRVKEPSPVSAQYLSNCIKKHEEELGWEHRITAHTFRRAIGTHLYENGYDLLTIQRFLGHRHLNSTTIYIRLANIVPDNFVNPFDCMGVSGK